VNLLFPDRDGLTRDPLRFLLSKADSASAPMTPLSLGFHRVLLVSDLALMNGGPFFGGTLCVPASPSSLFSPIEISQASTWRKAQPKTEKSSEDCTTIVNGITNELLIGLRKGIFSAYRHASFDCWQFSTLLATKLTFTALFGSSSEDVVDRQAFSHHAEIVHSFKDLIALDIICGNERQRIKKEQDCKQSLQVIQSAVQKAFSHRQAQSVCAYAYETTYPLEEICQLALAIQQATSEAFFWTIFALSRTQSLRAIIEEEADACLSSDGDLDKDKLDIAHATKNISLEILRLVPANNIIVFDCKSRSILAEHGVRGGDKLVVCPYVIFRSTRYFSNADNAIIGRKYGADLLGLQYLSCGGGVVFQIVLLNLALLLLDLAAAFELELVEGPGEFVALPSFRSVRPDIKVRLNLRRSKLFR
jgi:cytochrome P450